jgi:RHS repeat-associated protein
LLAARSLPSRRRHWRNRRRVRRLASGRTIYNYFRDYDPGVGRYVESDPIGLDGGINPYLYVDADPVSLMDELGLAPGQIFPTEAAAARDIEEYQSAIDDHNSWWLTQLAGDQLWVVGPYEAECGWTWDLVSPVVGFPPAVGRPNIGIQHSTRKAALDAGKHAHKGPPRPTPKKTDTKKRRQYEEQQRYRYPERHPGSRYPDPHYHDSNKSTSPVNRHHRYPRGR